MPAKKIDKAVEEILKNYHPSPKDAVTRAEFDKLRSRVTGLTTTLVDLKDRIAAVSAGGSSHGETHAPDGASSVTSGEPPTQALEPGQKLYEALGFGSWPVLPPEQRGHYANAETTVTAYGVAKGLRQAAAFCRSQKHPNNDRAFNEAYGDAAVEFDRRAAKERGE